jgi:hypothetical protein
MRIQYEAAQLDDCGRLTLNNLTALNQCCATTHSFSLKDQVGCQGVDQVAATAGPQLTRSRSGMSQFRDP